ncbi:MAG TPA: MYG1 family protein [Sandaracinaceae bacterium LLY-WYZ-13_1]|nr:MYG1 family protein [Sandaracinaceae bacterium LLY-WYZ-13_1]
MLRTILTHPGGAHKDDFLAVCVLAAKHGAPVVRREPTDEDLDDPAVAVIDVGGSHDPSRMNFDHHHFGREHPPTCALSLVLAHLDRYEDAKRFCDWLEPAEWFDSRGPKKTAEHLGVPRRAIGQLLSPIDVTLLRRFAASEALEPGEPIYEVMRFVGEDLLDYLDTARARIAFVEERGERWTLEAGDDRIEVAFLPRTDPFPDEPSATVAAYVRARDLGDVLCATVYPDRRGPGYGIARWEDHPRLDFQRVADEADVTFAHASGFVCKTTATDPERLEALILGAWR